MPLLPESPAALVGLVLVAGGLAVVLLNRTMPKAYGLAAIILAVFLVQMVGALFLGGDALVAELGFRSGPFLAGEQWWAPVTYMFVHAGFLHLVGNLLLLVAVGPILEDRLGARAFLAIYLGSGVLVLLSHLLMTYALPIVEPWQAAVGASGALFAILTVLAYHWPREQIPFPFFILIWLPAFLVLMLHLAINLALMVSPSTGVAWYGHFAGFLLGLAAAVALRPVKTAVMTRRLPDPDRLAPLATSPGLQEILQRLRETSGTAKDDATFAEAWLDRFFAKARCPAGHELRREGLSATCAAGEYRVSFGR